MSFTYQQEVDVPFHFPVIFAERVFSPGNSVLRDLLRNAREAGPITKVRVWIDEDFLAAQPGLSDEILTYFETCLPEYKVIEPAVYPGGEVVKEGWTYVNQMVEDLRANHVCRHSYVLAVGGGAFLDAAGFAAAMFHRGVRLVRMPTTVLAQDDSGVGVKNGINFGGSKNLLGCFAPPFAVVNDLEFLQTLPREVMHDGLSEAFKVAIIKDKTFLDYLSENAERLRDGEREVLNETVRQCACLHLKHIATGGDPFEMGSARPLDFGHWAAHRLESLSNYKVRHGQAVAIGVALDSWYACAIGLIDESERNQILDALERTSLPTYHPLLSEQDENGDYPILEGLEQFREHLGGVLCVTLPDGLGNKTEVSEIDLGLMIEGIHALAERK